MLEWTICLDAAGEKPLYEQLYDSLSAQIRSGTLQAGDRLPGKRSLASQLAVAVNTVDTAYQMLVAEGYLEARERSGFFVLECAGAPPQAAEPAEAGGEEAPPEPEVRFDLSTGSVDTALFPFRTWGRIQKELLYHGEGLLRHGHRQGDGELRRELAAYLRAYRGVVCAPEQIVVGAGVEYLLGLLAQLLRWAAAREGRYILEDDYDAEFRFDMRPLPSLQGMGGGGGRVVYLCTFSKSLAPSIRIACMVLPWELLGEYRRAFGSYSNTVSRFEQQTLRLFLEGGYFTRHLARMRGAYKGRMERLAAALEERFEAVRLSGRHTGLHLLLQLPEGPGEEAMIRRALEEGVRLKGLSEYYMERRERCGDNCVILGYASLRDGEIGALAEALGRAWGRE